MTLAQLIPIILQASVCVLIFSLGLRSSFADLTHVLSRPSLLLRSLLAMAVIMPVLAVILVKVIPVPATVGAAIVALSLAPVPPLLPGKQTKAGGRDSYAIGLLVAASLLSIVWIPLAISIMDPLFKAPLRAPPMAIANVVIFTLLAPLAVGALIHQIAPEKAERVSAMVSPIALLLLIVAVLPVIVINWQAIAGQARDGTLLTFAVFILVGLVVGHVLGGPDGHDRTVLALATAARHPGVALTIAYLNFPGEKAIAAAVVLYLLVSAVLTFPYVAWRKRLSAAVPKAHPS